MDAVEIESGHRTKSYVAVAQVEGDLSELSVNEIPPPNGSRSTTTSNDSDLVTERTTQSRNGGQHQIKQLRPKAYRKRHSSEIYCWFVFACLVGICIPIIIFFSIMMPRQNPADLIDGLYTTFCTDLQLNSTFIGPIQDILNVDIAFGYLTFSQAKFIDLVWDLGFSRGGQLLFGWITYKIHNAAMLRIMETDRVPYSFYMASSFSWPTLWHLVPLWATKSKLQGKRVLLLSWLMFSTLWVAFWPTLTNALTGYVASKGTVVKLLDSPGYMTYSAIANPETLAFQYVNKSTPDPAQIGGFAAIGPVLTKYEPDISLWNYLNSIVQNKTAVSYGGVQPWLRTGFDVGNYTAAIPIFYYHNQSYVYDYFQNATFVQCVVGASYQWGFSFSVLFYFMILNGLWMLGTCSVWTHLFRKSRFVRNRPNGIYRAVLDMAEVIHKDLGNHLCAYTDDELEYELKQLPGVRYLVEDGSPGHIGLTTKEEDAHVVLSYDVEYGRAEIRGREM